MERGVQRLSPLPDSASKWCRVPTAAGLRCRLLVPTVTATLLLRLLAFILLLPVKLILLLVSANPSCATTCRLGRWPAASRNPERSSSPGKDRMGQSAVLLESEPY